MKENFKVDKIFTDNKTHNRLIDLGLTLYQQYFSIFNFNKPGNL